MPIYDFRCNNCAYEFEEIVNHVITITDCPKCKGAASRLISAPSKIMMIEPTGLYTIKNGKRKIIK